MNSLLKGALIALIFVALTVMLATCLHTPQDTADRASDRKYLNSMRLERACAGEGQGFVLRGSDGRLWHSRWPNPGRRWDNLKRIAPGVSVEAFC